MLGDAKVHDLGETLSGNITGEVRGRDSAQEIVSQHDRVDNEGETGLGGGDALGTDIDGEGATSSHLGEVSGHSSYVSGCSGGDQHLGSLG
ncbi:unnamed protein product [Ilex paraguariensis]